MKFFRLSLIVAVCALIVSVFAGAAQLDNLLINPSFEGDFVPLTDGTFGEIAQAGRHGSRPMMAIFSQSIIVLPT